MKVRELLEMLDEKQKKTVLKCVDRCGIPELEAEVDPTVDEESIRFLKAISNPLRFVILKLLRDQWLCVCVIANALEQDQTLISHHLRTLKYLGLVEDRKEGRMHFYRAKKDAIEKYLQMVGGELLGE